MEPKKISSATAEALRRSAYDPKKLALLHTGAAMLFSLLITALNFLLSQNMDAATGLAQMGSRAILGTVQSILSLAGTLLLPFWQVSFLYVCLKNLRTADGQPADLLEGFRRWAKVARLYVLIIGISFLLVFLCAQLASVLISFTPFWRSMMTDAQAILEKAASSGQTALTAEEMTALLPAVLPTIILTVLLLAVIGIPLFYRFRLAFFAVMDDAPGARAALKYSGQLTRGYKKKLFLLDLHFWWYYAAMALFGLIAYGDVILPYLGVDLPVSADTLFFITYIIYILLQTLFSWQFAAHVQTCYAMFYDKRKESFPKEEAARQQDLPQLPEADNRNF
ncbi:MAG: DUF975 family protein [Oscillospiraceae bacterium]|nr:DUF975 family protein [Oscillospiraceae bacterium]